MHDLNQINQLLESLPYIKQFSNKTIVIKYGGAAMIRDDLKQSFAQDVVLLKYVGMNPVIVHGGGPEINQMLDILQIPVQFIKGHRVTDAKTMEIVEMVLSGKLNKQITSMINAKGVSAIGISGRDARLAKAEIQKLEVTVDGKKELIDAGFVGKIISVDPTLLNSLINSNSIPVISPVAEDQNGQALNINADTMAGAIASALKAEKLILLTDTEGVKIHNSLATTLGSSEIQKFIESGDISGGMIPKVECCLEAVRNQVSKAHIIDGRIEHSLLLELFTDSGVGTLIEK
jgi:acetylglutamate kinase